MGDYYQPPQPVDRNDRRGYANSTNNNHVPTRNSHKTDDNDGRRNNTDRDYFDQRREGGGNTYYEGGGVSSSRDGPCRESYDRNRTRRDSRDFVGRRDSMGRGGRGSGGSDPYDDRHRNFKGRRRSYNEDYNDRGGMRGDRGDDDYPKRRRMSDEDDFRRRNHHHRPDPNDDRYRRRRIPPKRKKPEWPSAFEEAGGNYVFDARSGLFYDAESDFFYDPKNKLYYSNEKKKYLRHCPENKAKDQNVFEEVNPDDSAITKLTGILDQANGSTSQAIDASQDLVLQALQGNNSNLVGKQDKKKINICIKKKFSGSAKKEFLVRETADEQKLTEEKQSLALKEHKADIKKWAKRAEEHGEDDDMITLTPNKIKLTKAGKPICCLCARKFADIDKLRQHEKHSALHKQNLEKKRRLNVNTAEYRDRASERRIMHEVDTAIAVSTIDPSVVEMGPSLDKARTITKTEQVAPNDTLGENNVGNQLLKKLGWKDGASLGSEDKKQGISSSSTQMEDKLAKLKQDWERIEHLSGRK